MATMPLLGVRRTAAVLLLVAGGPLAAQNIDTGAPPPNAAWPKTPFGRPAGGTQFGSVGQSFTVEAGAATRLTDFQFWISNVDGFGAAQYHAYVFPWDAATRRITGDFLFRSALQTGTDSPGPVPLSFATGGLDLVGGQRYIAVLSTAELAATPAGTFGGLFESTAGANADPYPGGAAYTLVSLYSAGLPGVVGGTWTVAGGNTSGHDFAFRAAFTTAAVTPIPEPSTVVLLGTGVLGVALAVRRRRRAG